MGLFENMKSEPVSRLNLRTPVLAKANEPLRDVVQRMRDRQLGCAVIVDDDQKPTAMFTESMLTQLMASKPDALSDQVGDHASDHWPQVNLDDHVVTVLEALDIKNIRFLSVVDQEGRIAGLAGQKGLMEYVADHFPSQVMVQRVGQKPFMQEREGA